MSEGLKGLKKYAEIHIYVQLENPPDDYDIRRPWRYNIYQGYNEHASERRTNITDIRYSN